MAHPTNGDAPGLAADAVLRASAPVPDDAKQIQGIDFDQYSSKPITVEEMVSGMSTMGFQASALAEAVQIINKMVRRLVFFVPKFHQAECDQ